MLSFMKKTAGREYVIFATDPQAEWRSLEMFVRANSEAEASAAARRELARTGRKDWSIDLVVESLPDSCWRNAG